MTETEEKIIQAAIQTFVRYGARKTTMADIAEAAEVSRQTVYSAFSSKEGIIVASIRYITDRNLAAVRARLADCETLGEKLDAYFAETIVKSFELLQQSTDAEDLVTGHIRAGREEIEASHRKHETLVAGVLAPHAKAIEASGETVPGYAHFIVTVVMGVKYAAGTRDDLDALLTSLKTSVLRIVDAA